MIRRIRAFLRTLRELHWERTRGLEHVRKLRDRFPTCEIHENVFVRDNCDLGDFVVVWQNNYLSNCTVGRCTYFAPGSKIGNCDIGAFCSIGPEVRIGLGIHPTRGYVSTYPGFYSTNPYSCKIRFREDPSVSESARIRIGSDVWIGARAMILDGVEIGDGAVVGAGAVVVRDVSPYTIVGGSLARPILKRFPDKYIELLLRFRWWERDLDWIREHAGLFTDVGRFSRVVSEGSADSGCSMKADESKEA
jgi:acetyltransferase-like isoleucine patch superfamily enzyme